MTKSEYHNKKVKSGNEQFVDRLKRKGHTNGYESSESSDEFSRSSKRSACSGTIITINIDLGKKGIQVLSGNSNESAADISTRFCKQHKLGGSIKAKVQKMVEEKLSFFHHYKIQKR